MFRRKSLSHQLLISILGIYALITFGVTLVHIVIEYRYTKENIKYELERIAHIFEPALQTAIWNLNDEQLSSIAQGMNEMPLVYSVEIIDPNDNLLYHQGEKVRPESEDEELTYSYPLYQIHNGNQIFLADVTIHSSEQAIFERLKIGFMMLFLNAMIKSLALITLFYIAFRKHLEVPLNALMYQISNLKSENKSLIDVKWKRVNELSILQSKFNGLLKQIYVEEERRIEMVHNQNKRLEALVQERTSELEIANGELQKLATTDALTQIANRSSLDMVLNQAIAENERHKRPFSVVMIDIDFFKTINDTYGHLVGDTVLKTLAQLIKSQIRSVDTLGRWGGEEFMIVYRDIECQGAYTLADNIRQSVEHYPFEGVEGITISMGVAQYRSGASEEELLKHADSALYYSKEHGRNKVTSYCDEG
jgi:diguanylate cyclase (GGDEF)-like protein